MHYQPKEETIKWCSHESIERRTFNNDLGNVFGKFVLNIVSKCGQVNKEYFS